MRALWLLLEQPPPWVEVFGYALVALVAVQMLVGYRRVKPRWAPFRRLHLGIAWSIAGLMGVHGLIGVGHVMAAFFLGR